MPHSTVYARLPIVLLTASALALMGGCADLLDDDDDKGSRISQLDPVAIDADNAERIAGAVTGTLVRSPRLMFLQAAPATVISECVTGSAKPAAGFFSGSTSADYDECRIAEEEIGDAYDDHDTQVWDGSITLYASEQDGYAQATEYEFDLDIDWTNTQDGESGTSRREGGFQIASQSFGWELVTHANFRTEIDAFRFMEESIEQNGDDDSAKNRFEVVLTDLKLRSQQISSDFSAITGKYAYEVTIDGHFGTDGTGEVLGGSVAIKTESPAHFSDSWTPSAGELVVTGAEGSELRIEYNETGYYYNLIDSNVDGTVEW